MAAKDAVYFGTANNLGQLLQRAQRHAQSFEALIGEIATQVEHLNDGSDYDPLVDHLDLTALTGTPAAAAAALVTALAGLDSALGSNANWALLVHRLMVTPS